MAGIFFLVMLLLNAPAMLDSAEKMQFDAPARKPAIAILKPIANISHSLFLDKVRTGAQSLERKYLE